MTEPTTPPGSGAEYTHQIRAVMDRAAEVEAATGHRVAPQRPVLTSPPVMVLLAMTFGAVVAWNVMNWTPAPAPVVPSGADPTPELAVVVAAGLVAEHRRVHGALPASLSEVGLPEEAFVYRVDGDRFELSATAGEDTARFDSADGEAAVFELLGTLATPPEGAVIR